MRVIQYGDRYHAKYSALTGLWALTKGQCTPPFKLICTVGGLNSVEWNGGIVEWIFSQWNGNGLIVEWIFSVELEWWNSGMDLFSVEWE